MTSDEAITTYWNYYLSIESQVIEMERFIEFDLKKNGETYSARLQELLQTICSEIDVVGKVLANHLDTSFVPSKHICIYDWWLVIQGKCCGIQDEKVGFRKDKLFPWNHFFIVKEKGELKVNAAISDAKKPDWWNAYNKVKHYRTYSNEEGLTYYSQANLINVFNALAGLLVLEVLLLEKTGSVVDTCKLFSMEGHHVFRNYMSWGAV